MTGVPVTPEITEKVRQHLLEKWKGRGCPMCEGGPWQLANGGAVNIALSPAARTMPVSPLRALPCMAVVCQSCGYTALINLVMVAGLADWHS